jgi:membrane fusion protein (multidrug efflux system)
MLISATNSVLPQVVQLGNAVGADWIIASGLKTGDRVIVAGLQKAMPGMTVVPVPVDTNTNTPPSGQ